jgi:hypothetical protein
MFPTEICAANFRLGRYRPHFGFNGNKGFVFDLFQGREGFDVVITALAIESKVDSVLLCLSRLWPQSHSTRQANH